MDMGALDPVLRNANVAKPAAAAAPTQTQSVGAAITKSHQHQHLQQLPHPLPSPWQSQHAQQTGAASASAQAQRQSSSSFSPQTQGSTPSGTALTPSDRDHATTSASPPAAHNTSTTKHPSHTTPPSTATLTPPIHATTAAASTTTTTSITVTAAAAADHPNDPHIQNSNGKKPRACESCRGLKVRCDVDPADPEGPCRRCVKAKRACVVTQPTRKRQKKTDSRVAELEKKIDALTASLVAKGAAAAAAVVSSGGGEWRREEEQEGLIIRNEENRPAAPGQGQGHERVVVRYPSEQRPQQQQSAAAPSSPPTAVLGTSAAAVAGVKRKFDGEREAGGEEDSSPVLAGQPPFFVPRPPSTELAREQRAPDVVDKGHLTMAMANELFARYTNQMCQHLPGVVFPPGMTAGELRATKPTLFLAVMAAASSEQPPLQKTLTYELMQVFGDKIFVQGNKSLELVQAVQLSVIWYWPPERFEELKFYQLVHVAAVMAIEIGLGRKKHIKSGFRKHLSTAWRDHPLKKPILPDPTTIEARRTWLTCYFLATNTAMALHRPNLIHWTPFIAECIDVLESSPEAAPTDKYLCHLVWTHKLAEEVGIQFSMDDPASTPNIADARTQYALKGFERELEKYSSSIPLQLQQPSLKISFHVLSLYMHEIATHNDNVDDSKLNPTAEALLGSDAPLSPAHINALSACLTAIDGIFEVFLSLDIHTIRCLPVFNFVRVAYAVVVLVKLYFAASSPKSELGKVINKDNMKVEQHLDNLLKKFRATAAEDKNRPAAKFLVVLFMIRSWFHKHKQGNGGSNDTPPYHPRQGARDKAGNPTPQPQQQEYRAAAGSTPLQLLSEIATNDPAAASPGPGTTRPDMPQPNPAVPGAPAATPWLGRQSLLYNTPGPQPDPATASGDPSFNPALQPLTSSSSSSSAAAAAATASQAPPFFAGNPFLTAAGLPDFEYYVTNNDGDGFPQAVDMALGGLVDGGFMFGADDDYWYGLPGGAGWFASQNQFQGVAACPGSGQAEAQQQAADQVGAAAAAAAAAGAAGGGGGVSGVGAGMPGMEGLVPGGGGAAGVGGTGSGGSAMGGAVAVSQSGGGGTAGFGF
ncbi:hypothetical protein VTK26DRAFT_4623 [Humicola hyalothermophila]